MVDLLSRDSPTLHPLDLPRVEIGPAPPPWVEAVMAGAAQVWSSRQDGLDQRVLRCGGLELASVAVPGARLLDAEALQKETRRAYQALLTASEGRPLKHPTEPQRERHIVRIWNFIPEILEPLGELPHRYMVFNAGRYDALAAWYRSHDSFPVTLATATGTGHKGDDLVLHALTTSQPGVPVENPRQIPSYRYSFRYGPRPPAFARATRVVLAGAHESALLVGGTASILGEDSQHDEDLEAQANETAANLNALLHSALAGADDARSAQECCELSRFRSVRIYYPVAEHRERIEEIAQRTFSAAETVELLHWDLCRPELLIEIEGVATLD